MSKNSVNEPPRAFPNAFDDRRLGGKRRLVQLVAIIIALAIVGAGLYMILGTDESDKEGKSASAAASSVAEAKSGIEAVDLGLSVRWASCNVGAEAPEEYGDYYAWGECEVKDSYGWKGAKSYDRPYAATLQSEEDVATQKLGDGWRMPTADEVRELIEKCEVREAVRNGCYGFEFVAPNNNTIFLPAAGYRYDTTRYNDGFEALYWSSSSLAGDNKHAMALFVNNHEKLIDSARYRYYGATIRPVKE
jgi:uncharacterized protein (TIGR02145 family)